MIASAASGSFLRPAQTYPSTKTLTVADALPAPAADETSTAAKSAEKSIPVSTLKEIDKSKLKAVSIADLPELRDRLATAWLDRQVAEARMATEVPDNAPQNVYATVKVNGKVVATLYNGGSVAMTNAAAGAVGTFQDPPGLGGPNLAQWRAETIAKATGGTIEKAPTAIAQSAWTPRQSLSTSYTRAQLDAAFEAMIAEGQRAGAQRLSGYPVAQERSGARADVSA
jgi:hypothetical protein